MPLGKEEILELVLAEARQDGWSVAYLSDGHPFDLVLRKGDGVERVRIYIWRVTHGGATRAADEYRIQITGVEAPLRGPEGFKTLILGWHEDLEVVAAFDPQRHEHQSGSSSPSIQIGLPTLQAAAADRALKVHPRGESELAVAFPPELLVAYIQQEDEIHNFGDAEEDIEVLEAAGSGEDLVEGEPTTEREKVVRTLVVNYRQASFRKRVLGAYGDSCAVCGIQMGIVEAAHIVPVGDPTSTDETSNGLALCPTHHAAYDKGIIAINRGLEVLVNEEEIELLRESGIDAGLDGFIDALPSEIMLPDAANGRPNPEYLERGMRARGWQPDG